MEDAATLNTLYLLRYRISELYDDQAHNSYHFSEALNVPSRLNAIGSRHYLNFSYISYADGSD